MPPGSPHERRYWRDEPTHAELMEVLERILEEMENLKRPPR
jgi:hypothetical protein